MNHKPGSVTKNFWFLILEYYKVRLQDWSIKGLLRLPSVLKSRYRLFQRSLPAFNRRAADGYRANNGDANYGGANLTNNPRCLTLLLMRLA